jgi:hypothetical protein
MIICTVVVATGVWANVLDQAVDRGGGCRIAAVGTDDYSLQESEADAGLRRGGRWRKILRPTTLRGGGTAETSL